MLTIEDRWAIAETLARHGHLFDEGHLDRLDEVFTSDVVYDVTELDFGILVGIEAIRTAALQLGARNPVAHLVTNIIIETPDADDEVTVRSKGLAVTTAGTCGSATYIDTLRRTPEGWRIAHRKIVPRRVPLSGRTARTPE